MWEPHEHVDSKLSQIWIILYEKLPKGCVRNVLKKNRIEKSKYLDP